MMPFERLIAIRLVSHDAAALAGFYVAALGFEPGSTGPIAAEELALLGLAESGTRTALALAGQVLEIDQFDPPGLPYPLPRVSDDRLFQHFAMTTADMPGAWARVLAAGSRPVSTHGPVQLPPANGSVQAVKFRDPEGHPLELLAFPDNAASAHPLVIDHSAIVVRDLAASLDFYHARGLATGERTLNHGPAQAALDGLHPAPAAQDARSGPRVDVVPLDPSGGGAHLELLGYRDPAPRPETAWQVNDVAATRLVWHSGQAAIIADPDGHLHQCQPPDTQPASP